jgi:hypothetical protein
VDPATLVPEGWMHLRPLITKDSRQTSSDPRVPLVSIPASSLPLSIEGAPDPGVRI